jgi:hypothetical protein
MSNSSFGGIYRGIVKDNTGDKGRCKVFVKCVYPDEFENEPSALPWAEPAMPLFFGNYTSDAGSQNAETGLACWPKVGAHVWVFFCEGDFNYPIMVASIQGGNGWISEHNKQYTIQTDNVRIRIDENPDNPASTSKFTTYNDKCTVTASDDVKEDVPTRLDIEITGNVNVKINGNVNLQINGNLYNEINGNKYETINGNCFTKITGDQHLVYDGDIVINQTGDNILQQTGNRMQVLNGDTYNEVYGSCNEIIEKVKSLTVGQQYTETIVNKSCKLLGQVDTTVIGTEVSYNEGDRKETITGNFKESISGNKSISVGGSHNVTDGVQHTIKAPQIRLN